MLSVSGPMRRRGLGGAVEALLFMLDGLVMVALVFMGLRDDRRAPGAAQTSLFRTREPVAPDRPAPPASTPPASAPWDTTAP